MTKAVALVHNQNERALSRQALKEFKSLALPGNLPGIKLEMDRAESVDLLLIDERISIFDNTTKQSSDLPLKIIKDFRKKQNSPNCFIAVILNEGATQSDSIKYMDAGVDFFIKRPFGAKEAVEKMAPLNQLISNPPALVKLMRGLRGLIENQHYSDALATLEPLTKQNPEIFSVRLMLIRCLMAGTTVQKERALALLEESNIQHPKCFPILELLRDGYYSFGNNDAAFRHALAIIQLDKSVENLTATFQLAKNISSFPIYLQWFDAFNDDTRIQVLSESVHFVKTPQEIQLFLDRADKMGDSLTHLRPGLEKLAKDFSALQKDAQNSKLYLRLLECLLKADPGAAPFIEIYADMQIAAGALENVAHHLNKARELKKFFACGFQVGRFCKNLVGTLCFHSTVSAHPK